MRAAREWGGARSNLERRPLLPGLARGGNARTGTRTSGAPPLEPLPAGSCARARIGDPAEAPPLPPLREPGSPPPPHALQGRTGGWCTTGRRANREARPGAPSSFAHRSDTHTRAALVCKAETGTAGRRQVPTPPFARERGSCTGRVRANPERRPLSLLHRSDARTDGVGLGGGVRKGCARASGEWGAHPFRADLCAEQRAGARGHKRRHAGGYTEWSAHE
ncbi:hypothetical protein EDB85DRAFT_1929186 [Lactarius pseudohatsudake]|nr:hypothetical protein EDB85DRAFT_1929186 [Lactarius pseudohatsudake]